MNDKKRILYVVHWRQDYPNFEKWQGDLLGSELTVSDFKEANELIEKIKCLK